MITSSRSLSVVATTSLPKAVTDRMQAGLHAIPVRMPHHLDQSVRSEPFEQARDLSAVELRQMTAQRFVLESADIELAASDGAEQGFIFRIEQVEPGVAAAFLFDGL
jgi:hypothetical protein